MGGHRERCRGQRSEGGQVDGFQLGCGTAHDGERLVAVGFRPAVTREVLDHRKHTARKRPSMTACPSRAIVAGSLP